MRPALLAGLLSLPAAALADYSFVLPSSTSLSGEGNVVTVDAAGADHLFAFDHRPIPLGSIKVWRPDGSEATPANTVQGRFRSVFDLRLDQQGTWRIESLQTMVTGTFKSGGEERRVGGRASVPPTGPGGAGGERRDGAGPATGPARDGGAAPAPRRLPPVALEDLPADATDLHLAETIRAAATFVTLGAPSQTVLKPTGKGLEFDPITHPNALAAGETARFRFLLDGKPAAGLAVTAIPGGERYREELSAIRATTGNDGIVAIKWPAAGLYWLGVEAEDRKPSEKRAEVRKMAYAVTLEVMTP